MKTTIKKFKGHILILKNEQVMYDDHNEEGHDAGYITIRALANSNEYIAKIALMQDAATLAIADVSSVDFLAEGTAKFTAVWGGADFVGSFNKVELRSPTDKVFAFMEGLEVAKTADDTMSIGWTLTNV